ncbi:hypothetical protein GCM10023093_31240 [Nemorincola caseinilytica]|uniref:Outer membrane protein beta-barrel domain-containing protein n=1 Tax=Nemorincola caseinilytica TaxID=2054315 RepID=A0ABP8NQX9_9BACT
MRPILTSIALTFLTFGAVHARIAVAPTVAASWAGAKATSSLPSAPVGNVTGIRAGIQVQKRITPHFYLAPGLFYSVYGYKTRWTGIDVQYRYNAAEVPLYLLLKTGMPCKPRLVLGAGLFGAMFVNNVSVSESGTHTMSGKNSPIVGVGLTVGLEFPRGLYISGTYQSMKNDMGTGPQNLFQYSLGVGFLFGKVSRKCS